METSGWLLLAGVFWIFGYVKTKFGSPTDGKYILIPKWLNIAVCGLPRSSELPDNSVLIVGLRAQIIGWLIAIYGIVAANWTSDALVSFMIGFVGSLVLSKVLVSFIDNAMGVDIK